MDSKLNSEKIWKIQKKIVKWYGKYERKVSWKVKRYEKNGRKVVFSIFFHYSAWVFSIFFISFHYSTCLSSILSISYHYLTCLSSIFSISFHITSAQGRFRWRHFRSGPLPVTWLPVAPPHSSRNVAFRRSYRKSRHRKRPWPEMTSPEAALSGSDVTGRGPFTIQLSCLPYFPYLFTIQLIFQLNREKNWKIQKKIEMWNDIENMEERQVK
jgi:hypothetical protein